MPTEDSIGGDERSDVGEGASANSFAQHSQSATLIVCEPESLPTELLFQDSILFAEVLDNRVLLTANPTGHRGDEDLPRLKDDGHRSIMPILCDNRQLSTRSETA
jgi:hypothetical protein